MTHEKLALKFRVAQLKQTRDGLKAERDALKHEITGEKARAEDCRVTRRPSGGANTLLD